MPSRTTRKAPPEVLPDTMRMASPSDWAKALMAGFGPMSVMSSASAKSASTASGPALKVLVSMVTLSPALLLEQAAEVADDAGRVGDVREVAEPHGDRLGGLGVVGVRRVGAVVVAAGRRRPARGGSSRESSSTGVRRERVMASFRCCRSNRSG